MSRNSPGRTRFKQRSPAVLFAALGDKTRLALVARLSAGRPASIAQLTAGARITRQAVTKHLCVLQSAGIVHSVRAGRENRFALEPRLFQEMKEYLSFISRQWDESLARLKSFVER